MNRDERKNEIVRVCCAVCLAKAREENPSVVDCAFRAFDGELCPELKKEMERM